jgi:hypothetical protein
MPDILHYIAITATPTKVYADLTEQKGRSGWWTRDVKAEPKLGAIDQFRFGNTGFNDMKIVPSQREVAMRGWREGVDRHRTHLRPEREGGGTVLLFAQRGWRE